MKPLDTAIKIEVVSAFASPHRFRSGNNSILHSLHFGQNESNPGKRVGRQTHGRSIQQGGGEAKLKI